MLAVLERTSPELLQELLICFIVVQQTVLENYRPCLASWLTKQNIFQQTSQFHLLSNDFWLIKKTHLAGADSAALYLQDVCIFCSLSHRHPLQKNANRREASPQPSNENYSKWYLVTHCRSFQFHQTRFWCRVSPQWLLLLQYNTCEWNFICAGQSI